MINFYDLINNKKRKGMFGNTPIDFKILTDGSTFESPK